MDIDYMRQLAGVTEFSEAKPAAKWVMLSRDRGDRAPREVARFGADKSEDDIVKSYEQGQGHKLKKTGDGTYNVITKSGTIGSKVYILPVDKLPKSETEDDCGCDANLEEARAEAENAIWKAMPPDNRAKIAGHRKVMLTGSVAKAAKLPEYTSIKLADLTDHQLQSVLAVIQRKHEASGSSLADFVSYLSESQVQMLDGLNDAELHEALNQFAVNLLLSEATPDLVRHCVRSVGQKYNDVSRAFAICTAQLQKTGYLKAGTTELTAKGKAKEKEHAADPDAASKNAEYEKMLKQARKSRAEDSVAGRMKALLDEGKCEKCGARLGAQNPGSLCSTCKWRKHEGLNEAPKKTYAQAQDDIMTGLEKDGWKVQRRHPQTFKPLAVPYATSKDGSARLYFKAQAIYLSHDKNSYGKAQHDIKYARSLHLPDLRDGDYNSFGKALSRWTGEMPNGEKPSKAAPGGDDLAKKAAELGADAAKQGLKAAPAMNPAIMDLLKGQKVGGDAEKILKAYNAAYTKTTLAAPVGDKEIQLSPDQYRAKHGSCPDGYHYDDSSKRCVKAKTEDSEACPKCGELMEYDEKQDAYACEVCAPKGAAESVEVLRLAGVSRYPDRMVSKSEAGFFKGRAREYAGVAAAHEDWRLEAPEEDRMDLWHPDKHVKNPGLPMDKTKAAEKGPQQLLKALKCPPGKAPKLVFGRPTCAPKE